VGDAFSAHHYSHNVSQAAAQGIKAGCDLDCGSTYKAENLEAALGAGLMDMSDLDVALERTFAMRFNLGMFDAADTNNYTTIGKDVLNNGTQKRRCMHPVYTAASAGGCVVHCVVWCTVYCVLCTVYCVLCTVYCVLCTVYLCTACTVYCV
jgi:beta-glucosidase-like glycosyl hydrolase